MQVNTPHKNKELSPLIVEKNYFTFAENGDEFLLESGDKLKDITLAYETLGTLNQNKSNVILILHALTGDSHVAGVYEADDSKPGWWDIMVGPGKAIDTDTYHIICSNILGGCMGTTGPLSKNDVTGKKFGMDFPVVTIGDMVKCQKKLLDHLGVTTLLAVIGGSLGGMQVLEWSIRYPEMVQSAIPLATTMKHSALAIAFNEVARQAIVSDPKWNHGNYTMDTKPDMGLSVARMIGHITYLSDESMRTKFGRKLQENEDFSFDFDAEFQIESYLRYQAKKFVNRFDANSFLYITKAADYFDIEKQHGNGSPVQAFSKAKAKFLVISFTSDWLYPTYESRAILKALKKNRCDVSFCEIEAKWGHDAFLLPNEKLNNMISGFLDAVYKKGDNHQ